VLEVGTGSGAVALALADELPGVRVTATDSSVHALEVARANASRLGLAERISFREGSVPDGQFDLVVANLPYVSRREWELLAPEISAWEPRSALLGGEDGLDVVREVVPRLDADIVALEVGAGQAGAVAGILRDAGLTEVSPRRDLAGIDRVVVGRR
jgi:release factor glutamine methyltransferase